MREIITVADLLSRINKEKSLLDDLKATFIDPATSNTSKLFASVYNETMGCTLSGMSVSDYTDLITKTDSLIKTTSSNLRVYQCMKDVINSSCTIMIPEEPGSSVMIDMHVSQALIIVSPHNQEFQLGYLDRLASDYTKVTSALEIKQNKSLDQDKIDTYVRAKLTAITGSSEISVDSDIYKKFAQEYIDANKYKILDPLRIGETIFNRKKNLLEFFETIKNRIKIFNFTTRIEIDLDSGNCQVLK